MILDDLFEQKPLPAHIKPSDLPPAMRSRLTMRDIEQERPRGAYRYRVTPSKPGESPKDFLDLPGAEQYAQAVGGRVTSLEEQVSDPDVQRGMTNLLAIERQLNTNQKVVLQNETGQPAYQIELPVDKQWLITHAQEWIDAGKGNDLYKYMGTNAGFEFLLAAWQKEDVLRDKRAREKSPEEPDLFGSGQAGGPKSPRYQRENQQPQKKTSDLAEAPQGARGRTERMLAQMRARQPQATSDLEALAYELQDAERRDAEEINKLERDVDNLETDVKSELQKRVATLTKRKGGIQQAAAADTKIDATLDQLAQINDKQQREIIDLERAVASLGQSQQTVPSYGRVPVAQPTAPVTPAVVKPKVARSKPAAKPAAATPTTVQASPAMNVDNSQTKDFRSRFAIGSSGQEDMFQKAAESIGDEVAMAKSALGTFGRALLGKQGPAAQKPPRLQQPNRPAKSVAAKPTPAIGKSAQPLSQTPAAIKKRQQRAAAKPGLTPSQPTVAPVEPTPVQQPSAAAHDKYFKKSGKPPVLYIGGKPVTAKDPAYAQLQAAMAKQNPPVTEKKKPVPTNPDLWSRAKSAARSKFDVYPSAYANAWAAKWYKSKGGGWRMAKPKKK